MLEISRSERNLIVFLLLLGVFFTALSFFYKESSPTIRIINFHEPEFIISVNKASAYELERLPGIGPILAQEIIAYRKLTGGFKAREEIKNIRGIGNKKFEKIKDMIKVK